MIKNAKSYMRIAKEWSTNSHAVRKKVGCIIVNNGRIISDGYNGMPSGFPNECEHKIEYNLVTKPEVLHAESNAIAKLATSTISSEGSSLFVTLSPCWDCAKLIIQCGIKEVYYTEDYHTTEGIILLKRAHIKTYKLCIR
tara:strand:- start:2460 stop:2879 length:420 start_codon:yes stop_codon:yes gene_type:complete